jgi:hypothetical protein
MTSDSTKYRPGSHWKERGFVVSKFGFWIDHTGKKVFPLYEGRMIGQFDLSQKEWLSAAGRRAVWRDVPFEKKQFGEQFLLPEEIYDSSSQIRQCFRFAVMRISSATNESIRATAFFPGCRGLFRES